MRKTRMRRTIVAAVTNVVLAPYGTLPAMAHHGWGGYDSTQTLTLTGSVREFTYQNPHGTVRLEASGKTWVVVLAPPSRMQSRGLPQNAIKLGDVVTVEGYPSRSDPEELRAERIRTGDKVTELR